MNTLLVPIDNALDSLKPYEHNIYLQEMYIAGTGHVPNTESLKESVNIGDLVSLFREPNNPYDKNAIVIETRDGMKLGYVPMTNNLVFARLMDGGKFLFGEITKKTSLNLPLRFNVKIFMRD
jgi:hypothetical protein